MTTTTATAKKSFADAGYIAIPAALHRLDEMRAELANTFAIELFDILHTSLPSPGQLEDGTPAPAIGLGEIEGRAAIQLADETQAGTLFIVTHYADPTSPGGIHRPDPTSAPLAVPSAVYLVNLPKVEELETSRKLADYRQNLIMADMLRKARAIAKGHAKDGRPLIADRVQALIAAASTKSGPEAVFRAMHPLIAGALIKQVQSAAQRLKDANKNAQAAQLLATYSKERLSLPTMSECFASKDAAAASFPGMPQDQWVKLLDMAIKLSERCPFRTARKGPDGKSIKDDAGKVVYDITYRTLSPEIFLTWKATRDQARYIADAEAVALADLSLSDMLASVQQANTPAPASNANVQ